ncbi:LrgB family protein [Bacillus aquiflavi]|uniref:LrgB family protein n=1 Tax=Bacillus aquiflavi TaxID=2672567 RepID=UPI001CA7D416|nr:LrgB family protein [Bacillus aquiflavi]UAC49586.1 LrgB family protein [Bacillus aquiflavi]
MSIIITLYSMTITIGSYLFSRMISKKYGSPLTSPVFLSTVFVIIILLFSHISYEEYSLAKEVLTFLLGPATVALAVPLYKQRKQLLRYLIPACIGLITGTVSTIFSALFLAKLFQLSDWVMRALSLKSITIPVASEVAKIIKGDEVLVAAFVMTTGMIGAMFGPWLMNVIKINDPFSRGLSMGTIAHGIGTAEVVKEGELQGAISAVAMGLAAIFTSLIIPSIITYLI